MEKTNSSKIVAIVALVVAVLGLSVGFAAYTSTLNISANANVQVDGSDWDVGFANNDTPSVMAAVSGTATTISGTGVTNAGSLSMYKYTITQGTAATLSTTANEAVSYAFKIKNAGSIDAILKSITTAGISCAYVSDAQSRIIEGVSGAGSEVTATTGQTISDADCKSMFTATLTLNGSSTINLNTFVNGTTTIPSITIDDGTDITAVLTITATGTVASGIDGDFTVSIGTTTVQFGSR